MNIATTIDRLYSYQSDAVQRIAAGTMTYLGFDPGLGKTRTAIEAAKARGAKRVLVFSPVAGVYVWQREVARWWPGTQFTVVNTPAALSRLKADGVVLVTYPFISVRQSPVVAVINRGLPFDMTVLDEAAALKNPGANRTKAILQQLVPYGKLGFVVPMSGTPAPNHAGELYPVLRALAPDTIRDGGSGRLLLQWEFEDRYCRVVKRRFAGREVRVIEGSRNLPELRQRIGGFMLRKRKEDVLKDLPPIRWDVVPLQPHSGMRLPDMSRLDSVSDDQLLDYLKRDKDGEHVMRLRHELGLAKTSAAIEYIEQLLQALPGTNKLVVFAHHKDVIAQLAIGLGNWSPQIITGATTPHARAQAVDNFLGKGVTNSRLFIGNIQAAGTALTLVGPNCRCSDVVFVEATYSVGDNVQAACRVHRIGQHDAVVSRYLTVHGTIDDRIHQILARKASDFSQLFD